MWRRAVEDTEGDSNGERQPLTHGWELGKGGQFDQLGMRFRLVSRPLGTSWMPHRSGRVDLNPSQF